MAFSISHRALPLLAALTAAATDPAQLARIAPRMQAAVDQKLVPGIVTLVMHKGKLVHHEAFGSLELENNTRMAKDSIFQIMSMTKPVTGVAIMMLADEGKLRLNDPVERHLPEFRGQWMYATKGETERLLRKPSRPVTIRDLMTHTSGLIANPPPGIAELLLKMDRPLAEAVSIYAQQPLEFEPGTRWMYSNPGIATLGRIVEAVSGMAFEKFLEERIFTPLGMKDTHIYLPPSKQKRLAMLYTTRDGKTVPAMDALAGPAGKYREGAKYSGPEYALHSTAADLAGFYQMMLDKGAGNGKRILSPAAVETMTAVHTGDIRPAGWRPGACFGLTWEVTCRDLGTLAYHSLGTFGHGGAFGTYGWIDPKRELVGVFLIQWAGNRQEVRDSFIQMATAAVE